MGSRVMLPTRLLLLFVGAIFVLLTTMTRNSFVVATSATRPNRDRHSTHGRQSVKGLKMPTVTTNQDHKDRTSSYGTRKLRVGTSTAKGALWNFRNPPTVTTRSFDVTSDIFNVSINTFSDQFVQDYTSEDELRDDLTQVLQLFANAVISGAYGFGLGRQPGIPEILPDMPVDDGGTDAPPDASGATDFDTNNQEEGVDEADVVKSDGTYVYAAYGDTLAVWEAATGLLITNKTMPAALIPIYYGPGRPEEDMVDGEDSLPPPQFYLQRANIRALLLESDRLVAVVEGYGGSVAAGRTHPGLYNPLATRLLVYSTTSLAMSRELTQVHSKDLNGLYRDAVSIGTSVHIVTTADMDVHNSLVWPLSRWQQDFIDLSDEAYQQVAKDLAEQEIIPTLVDKIVTEIKDDNGMLPSLARVGMWQEVLSGRSEVEVAMYTDNPVVTTYTQVASFDITDDTESLAISLSGAFLPNSYGHVYATPDYLIFAAQGWNWMPSLNGNGQTTYLLGFSLDGAASTPSAVGAVDGNILNEYSLDIQDGHLRIATTIQSFWAWIEVEQEIEVILEDGTPSTDTITITQPTLQRETQNQVIFLQIPDPLTGGGVFQETSRIPNLGKPGEVFTSVRFFPDIAYAVTFERTDPFYVLNVTDPEDPGVLGELNITGFSSYLHSINDDNTMLVAVGQEADENGRVLGTQVTIFNSTNVTDPSVVDRFNVELDEDTWSNSVVGFDPKAFRYLRLGDDFGLVIMPLYINNWRDRSKNFDGFLVLDVDAQTGISMRFNITHAQGEQFFGCYYPAQLAERSLVFQGKVTTMQKHSVISTDLNTGEPVWELEMRKPGSAADCSWWF